MACLPSLPHRRGALAGRHRRRPRQHRHRPGRHPLAPRGATCCPEGSRLMPIEPHVAPDADPADLGCLTGRIAGAPISWGVCEVPGWGVMLPPSRVLPEMRSLGLTATELGAPGFLPSSAAEVTAELDQHGMTLVGGFVPLMLHEPDQLPDAIRRAHETAALFQACGATRFVTAVVQDYDWSRPTPLTAEGMKILGEGLATIDEVCAGYGLTQVLHPHVDTLVETAADVELALQHSQVLWCLDTGHLQIGGIDPVEFARTVGHRVAHVHLKDVVSSVAAHVLSRRTTLVSGVQQG